MYVPQLLHPFICDGHIGCLHVFAVINNDAVNMGVQVSLWHSVIILFRSVFRSGIDGSYDSSNFNFLRSIHTVFHGSLTNLHSHQQCVRVSFSSHPCQLLLSSVSLISIKPGVRWYLIVVFIFTSLMISDVEQLFLYLLAICISSL